MDTRSDLLLSKKRQRELLNVVNSLYSSKNLTFIDNQLVAFHLLLNGVQTEHGINCTKIIFSRLGHVAIFFAELLAYAKNQHVFIAEDLDMHIQTCITRMDKVVKCCDDIYKLLRDEEHRRLKFLTSPRKDNISYKLRSDDPDLFIMLNQLEDSIASMEKWITSAADRLLEEKLLLPILHIQLKHFIDERLIDKAKYFVSKITSDKLFQIKTELQLAQFVNDFYVWQSIHADVINGLKMSIPLLDSANDILLSLLCGKEMKKFSGFCNHGTELKSFLTTHNPNMQLIKETLGIDKKIKQRKKTLSIISQTLTSSKAGEVETSAKSDASAVIVQTEDDSKLIVRPRRANMRRSEMARNRGYSEAHLFKPASASKNINAPADISKADPSLAPSLSKV